MSWRIWALKRRILRTDVGHERNEMAISQIRDLALKIRGLPEASMSEIEEGLRLVLKL